MYYGMWVNIPKEVMEYDDYTYEEHFGKPIPSYITLPVIRDYLEGINLLEKIRGVTINLIFRGGSSIVPFSIICKLPVYANCSSI